MHVLVEESPLQKTSPTSSFVSFKPQSPCHNLQVSRSEPAAEPGVVAQQASLFTSWPTYFWLSNPGQVDQACFTRVVISKVVRLGQTHRVSTDFQGLAWSVCGFDRGSLLNLSHYWV